MADPMQAARNVSNIESLEKRATEIRTLVARGIITDAVSQLARVMANRLVTGPEEIRLQDLMLREALAYVRVISSGPAAIEYMSPNDQARKVDEQSKGLAELEHLRAEAVGGDLEEGLRVLADTVPIGLPKRAEKG